MKQLQWFAAWFFAVTFSIWLGRAEAHTDDTGILVGLIGIGGLVTALVEPRRPWVWGLVVPAGIIVGNLWRHTPAVWGIAAVTSLVGCAGSYAGAYLRRSLRGVS